MVMKVEWELEDWENQGTQEARTEKERREWKSNMLTWARLRIKMKSGEK